ncbi:MAG: ATP-binding protein [Rhodospirillales bacterium]|nr:ATP-binding protein [Rhodospirillales bacterium]
MHTIADNDLFHRLAFDNPWWELKEDTKIQFKNPPRRIYFKSFFARLTGSASGQILALAGPLRAGKTVMLRQAVSALIEKGVKPTHVFYCNMTVPSYTATDLATLFEMFCRRYRHGPEAELYILYDEIQYVKEWEKSLITLSKMRPNARIVAAVSSGAPAITSGEKTHDGKITTHVLPPLSFLEFLRFRDSEQALFGDVADGGHSKMALRANALPALNTEFYRYINFGGFLEGIVMSKEGTPAPTFIRDGVADRVLHKDLASLHGINDAQELNRLFGVLAFNTAREVTIDELAKSVGIAKNTLRKYLDYLESAFLIRRLPRVDRDAKRFQRAVSFKVYLTAPCLYAALFAPVARDDQFFHRLAETALVGQWLGSPEMKNLAYASWRGGSIDLLIMNPETGKPDHVYEIDWNNRYGRPGKGPEELVSFVEGTNRKADTYILTGGIARPASMRGIDITLAPMALYAYWLERDKHSVKP